VASRVRRWPALLRWYVALHCVWFCLYAFLGKGFAHVGFAPLYVGEMLLLLACFALAAARRTMYLLRSPIGFIMVCFLAWQAACMLTQIGTYGLDSLRDSVIWGYAVFAWVAGALCLRLPGLLGVIVSRFAKFARTYMFLGPAAFLASVFLVNQLPRWPGTNASIPFVKGDEYCVHLAGILALISVGLGKIPQKWLMLVLLDALLGMNVRGGFLAFMVASSLVLVFRPKLERLALIFSSALLLIVTMATLDVKIPLPMASREFSLTQLTDSVESIFSKTQRSSLEGTKRWRLEWWSKIWDYTVEGPYFWTGKGYGINLADSDGFQVGTKDEPLRSPHSSHLTFLARSGVPGFLLWVALQAAWAGSLIASYLRARRYALQEWAAVFAWILAYWAAFMVAAGFDVFLEGPMAGIPFWTLFGVGWGAHILFKSVTQRSLTSEVLLREPRYAHAH
jgi:O-Antigen ligase